MISPILHVRDVDLSLAFYTQILGFAGHGGLPGIDGETVYAEAYLGAARLMLVRCDPHRDQASRADLYLTLPESADIDRFYADLLAREVAILDPLHEELWGDCAFSITDLDGSRLTFAQPIRRRVATGMLLAIA